MTIAVKSAYLESSQYKRWTLTREELTRRRNAVAETINKTISENVALEVSLSGPIDRRSEFPTTEESLCIVEYYASKINDTGTVLNLPSHLKATAAMYLKRFYLSHSPLHYHPKQIMITSLFLATKTCEHHVSLDDFVKRIPKLTREGIIEHEFLLSSTICFDFMVWSAYRPLYGFILDMEVVLKDVSAVTKAHDAAKESISACIWTDLSFLYSPSHIALSALHSVAPTLLAEYLKVKEISIPTLDEISTEMKRYKEYSFDRKEVEVIDRKLYYCTDPAMSPDSAISKRKRETEEQAESQKRRKKSQAAQSSHEELGQMLS